MKKLCLLLLIVAGFAVESSGQSIRNNTRCDIMVEISCLKPTTCAPIVNPPVLLPKNGGFLPIPVPPNPAACPGGLPFTFLHLWFAYGCNTNDPFIAVPGNCYGYPSTNVMTSHCHDCLTGTIVYLGGGNWEIN